MDWIKTRYDRFLVIVAAILLLAISAFLIYRATSFVSQFALRPESGHAKLPPVDFQSITDAQDNLNKPHIWETAANTGSLLRSRTYLEIDGKLIDPTQPDSPDVHPGVKNNWLLDHQLPIRDTDVMSQDPDADGFTNLEEYQAAGGPTDPRDPKSHPDFTTKLFLAGIKSNPFFLVFSAITQPEEERAGKKLKAIFQVDAANSGQPTQFLSLDDTISGSDYVLTGFKQVLVPQPNGINKDKSELSITNSKAETVILTLKDRKNVGKDDAIFSFRWKGDEQFARRVDQKFTLKPDEKTEYQVKEISPEGVKISRLSDGKEYLIKKP